MPLFITVTKALVTSPMPCVMSMLVLQPRMARFTDCIGDGVNVSVCGIGVKVVVGVGVNVISFLLPDKFTLTIKQAKEFVLLHKA